MLIITGTYPPERCGVGDYTQCLINSRAGAEFHLFYHNNWQLSNLRFLCRELKKTDDRVINLQYPTMGYSTHLTPHLLALYAVVFQKRKLLLTIHEYSQLGWKGKLALKILFMIASCVIFTTEFERDAAVARNPLMKRTTIIKINSNIPVAANLQPATEREWDMCFFGFIRPNKGLEEFVQVAKQLKQVTPLARVYVMGQVQKETKAYSDMMLRQLEDNHIAYIGDKSKDEVACWLNNTKVAYLPYPDGLSERRGSLLAAAVNGCIVVSNEGPFTAPSQKNNILLCNNQEAADTISHLLSDEKQLLMRQKLIAEYVKQNVPVSWDEVAEEYTALLKDI